MYSYANFPGMYAISPTNVSSNAKAIAVSCAKTLRIEIRILPTKRLPMQIAPNATNVWKIIHIFWQFSKPQAPSVATVTPSLINVSSAFNPHEQSPKVRCPLMS